MEAARALADLVEIAPQIEAAVAFEGDEELLGAIGVSDWWATAVARAGKALLESAAAESGEGGGAVTQLHASLGEGDVFAVGSPGKRTIVAVAPPRQAPGLVFYDLKRCLLSLDEPAPEPPAAAPPPEPPRKRRWGRRKETDGS